VTRRLVAVGDKVFVTLGLDAPLTILDAATGRTLRTCDGTANTEEIVVSDAVRVEGAPPSNRGLEARDTANGAFLLVGFVKWPEYRQEFSYVWDNSNHANKGWAWDGQKRHVVAVDVESGKILWKRETAVAPMTLAADAQRVYLHDGSGSCPSTAAAARRCGFGRSRDGSHSVCFGVCSSGGM
jgi:hypothetical protein